MSEKSEQGQSVTFTWCEKYKYRPISIAPVLPLITYYFSHPGALLHGTTTTDW